jgi:hypothetical protein
VAFSAPGRLILTTDLTGADGYSVDTNDRVGRPGWERRRPACSSSGRQGRQEEWQERQRPGNRGLSTRLPPCRAEKSRRDACARASERALCQRGASPLQAYALRPVVDRNCVAARRGGKQQETSNQSVGDERDSAGTACWPARARR